MNPENNFSEPNEDDTVEYIPSPDGKEDTIDIFQEGRRKIKELKEKNKALEELIKKTKTDSEQENIERQIHALEDEIGDLKESTKQKVIDAKEEKES